MYYTDGYVDVSVVVGGKTFVVRLTWHLDYTKYFGGLKADAKKMESKYTELTNKVDGMPLQTSSALQQYSSEILQSAREISLKVSETTTGLKNCIVGSALRPWDDIVKITAGLSQTVNIINGGGVGGSNYAVFNAQGATANTWTGLYFKDVRVTPGKKYTFSIWVKVIRTTDNGAYYTIKRFDNGVEGAVVKSGNYPNTVGDWVLYTYQITVPNDCSRLLIETAIRKNGTINLCRPMLMEGAEYGGWSLSPNDKTEAGKLGSDLISTGFDIENGKITATADKFEVRNNSGETTASVNEKGLLVVGAGLFSGFVKKKKIIITPENIDQYRIPAASLSVVLFDFTNAGSFVEFQGDFYNYFKTVQVDIILPFYNPKDNLYNLHGVPTDEALQYVGQTLIIKNSANITFVVHGGGTINKRGTTTSDGILKVNEISSNERLIATCEVTTTFGNPTSGVSPNRLTAVGWNGNIY